MDLASRRSLVLAVTLLTGCRGAATHRNAPEAVASTVPASSSAPTSSAPPAGSSSAPPAASVTPPGDASSSPPTATFVGANATKTCKATTRELATYQQRGDVSIAGSTTGIAAAWRVHIPGKSQEQVAFAAFDTEGRSTAKTRGVGGTVQEIQPWVFAAGASWTVVWFDASGLAYTRPKADPLPAPDVLHVSAIPADVVADVALAQSSAGAILAASPLGTGKEQLVLFSFGGETDFGTVAALGTTHHAKDPHRPAVTATSAGTIVAWDEGGALVTTHFAENGKESPAPCTIAPSGPDKLERPSLAAVSAGAIAAWVEGTHVRARALDAAGCPASPMWTVGEGHWVDLESVGAGAIITWVAGDGRLLAARLTANGAPPASGLDAADGSTGVKDPPSVVAFGDGKLAFGWAEKMSAMVTTKRIMLRIVDAACVP